MKGILGKVPCYVYFISDACGHIKIGVTCDITKRLHQLQTSSPSKLQLVAYIYDENRNARDIERFLHYKFCNCNTSGEWFDEDEILDYIQVGTIKINSNIYEVKYNMRIGANRIARAVNRTENNIFALCTNLRSCYE